MEILGVPLRSLAPILVIAAWFALSRWVLPRLGIRT
jgi:hypothetical protein